MIRMICLTGLVFFMTSCLSKTLEIPYTINRSGSVDIRHLWFQKTEKGFKVNGHLSNVSRHIVSNSHKGTILLQVHSQSGQLLEKIIKKYHGRHFKTRPSIHFEHEFMVSPQNVEVTITVFEGG